MLLDKVGWIISLGSMNNEHQALGNKKKRNKKGVTKKQLS
jgi:hypothetical protein